MDRMAIVDQLMYKADQYDVVSLVMGGASILEPASPKEALDAEAIADHICARLQGIPLLRKKLVQDPLRIGSVIKVENTRFDVRDHIEVSSLPSPGGYQELTTAMEALSARPLDCAELWRFTLLDGLEGGRLALVCQMHHALFDGIGATQTMTAMYDREPVQPEVPARRSDPIQDEPSRYALLGDAVAESTHRLLVRLPGFLRHNTRPMLSALGRSLAELRRGSQEDSMLARVTPTSLNMGESSGTRSIAYRTLSLPEIKQLARDFGCSVNDIGMLLFSFALQQYFARTGEKIDFDLRCGMPISTRQEGSNAGNQVTAGVINLHNTIHDVEERLQAIHRDTVESKANNTSGEASFDTRAFGQSIPPLLVDGLMYLASRLNLFNQFGEHYPVFNALLSNVPGPPGTLYIGNAKLVESIPLIPAVGLIAVSGGFTSVGDSITMGFHCDGVTVNNPELFVDGVDKGMYLLRKVRDKRAAPKKPAAKRRRKSTPGKKAD